MTCIAHHAEDYRHHVQSLHGAMVIDVCDPCAVKRYQATSIDSTREYIVGDKVTLWTEKDLLAPDVCSVFAFTDTLKPVVVGVRTVRSTRLALRPGRPRREAATAQLREAATV